ncbi:MAG: UDP-N-acetylmuramoyl-tripeptide--D-alanyl-D-alanine ligase [Gammaproteobacteria bacterium]
MKLSELLQPLNARLLGADVDFSRVSTDTRTLAAGDLFVALVGANFDGHDYVSQALAKGAVAAMVSRELEVDGPLLVVDDTLRGLGKLAACHWQTMHPMKVAITGSCGKTTLKEMVAAILSCEGETLATRGNLNNEIGVPLTLLQLRPEQRYAVIECGANHVGEIAYTAGLVQPDVAIVNIVAPAHLEGFGSIDRVAMAKGEIYDALKPEGVAIINLDDAYASQYLRQTASHPQLTFSLRNPHADVYAEKFELNQSGYYSVKVHSPIGLLDVELPLLGTHNVRNALASCAIAIAMKMPGNAIVQGLKQVKPTKGRLAPVTDIPGIRLIDDSYNANPASINAAIDVLAQASGDTCLVLGGMGELGEKSDAFHEAVGAYAAEQGIASVYSLGPAAPHYKRGFDGANHGNASFTICADHAAIAQALLQHETNKLILIKGSRSTAMEKVIDELRSLTGKHEEQS